MLSLFFEHPIIIGISLVLALVLTSIAENISPRLGEILGMNMVFPLVVFSLVVILFAIFTVGENFFMRKVKKRDEKEA